MRQSVLFYSFIGFFLTAIVTLLGGVGIIDMGKIKLNLLLGAFLIEITWSVIAVFKQTNFFDTPTDNLTSSLGDAIEAFDQISDKI